MTNKAIRLAMFNAELKQYQLAELLGCSEAWVSILLRSELPKSDQQRIVEIIKSYEADKDHDGNAKG